MITELHCHTNASDGMLTPAQLVALARARGIHWLAITDHDTTEGYELAATAPPVGMRLVPGIEMSSLSAQGEVHVLGYGVQPTDESTRRKIASLRSVRVARAIGILERLAQLGIRIEFARVQALAGDGMIGRPHVARAMIEAGVVSTQQQAFDEYLSEGKPGFVRHEGLTPTQAVQLIHAAHGVAVLAHPGLYRGDLPALVDEMCAAGLDGLEVYYPSHSAEQIADYEAISKRLGLLRTGGSDFHGVYGDYEATLGTVHIPDNCLADLDDRMRQRAP